MGDHRASIKIEFSMYGETKNADMWINWSDYSSEVSGVDQRVIDFFRDGHNEFREVHDLERFRREAQAQTRKREAEEKATYEKLKAKFEKESTHEP